MATHLITVWPKTSNEYKRLSEFAEICTNNSPLKYKYYVDETLFDAGQNWAWTTIIGDKCNSSFINTWQILCPKDLDYILDPTYDLNKYYKIWWNDRFNVERNDIIRIYKKHCKEDYYE